MKRKHTQCRESLIAICILLFGLLGCSMQGLFAQQLASMRLDGAMTTAAVSLDGHLVAINLAHSVQSANGSWESTESVEVLELASSRVVSKIEIPSAALLKNAPLSSTDAFVSYCGKGKYLVAYDLIGSLYVFDAQTYQVESKIELGSLPRVGVIGKRTMSCSADGGLIAVNAHGGQLGPGLVRVFDLASGQQIAELRANPSESEFTSISVSPNGSRLAVLVTDPGGNRTSGPNVEIRETKAMKLLSSFSTGDVPRGMIFAGESEIVTVQQQPTRSSSRQVLRLWDITSGKELKTFSDAHVGVDWPISASSDGNTILGYIPTYRECRFCNGLEGRREIKEQRFALWNKTTGTEIYRSEPFGPIVDPLGPRCVLNQSGASVMVYWPDNVITPRLFPVP